MNKIKVVLFTGGRGNSNLINILKETSNIELTLLINAFDDGLSTGIVRDIFPNLLGPSDFRKNISTLSSGKTYFHKMLSELMEFRIENFSEAHSQILKELQFEKLRDKFISHKKLFTRNQRKFMKTSFKSALDKIDNNFLRISGNEISIGNIFFSGIFLNNKSDFNKALREYVDFFQVSVNVLNVSNGINQKLVTISEDKKLSFTESAIVNHPQKSKLVDFLLLSDKEYDEFILLKDDEKFNLFHKSQTYSEYVNPDLSDVFDSADLIVYGSGTLFSSIYPSFKIASKEIKNSKAMKIAILNLDYDNDIIGLNATEIISNHLKYLNDQKNENNSIDLIILDSQSKIFNDLFENDSTLPSIETVSRNLRDTNNPNRHDGFLLTDIILDELKKYQINTAKNEYIIPLLFKVPNISDEEIDAILYDLEQIMSHSKFHAKLRFEAFPYKTNLEKLLLLKSFNYIDYTLILSIENNTFFNRLDLINAIYGVLSSKNKRINVQFSRYMDRKSLSKNINQLYYYDGVGKALYHLSHLTQLVASFAVKVFGYGHIDQDPFIGINLYNLRSLQRILDLNLRFCSNTNINICLHKISEEFTLYSLPYEEILHKGALRKRMSYSLKFFRDIVFGRFFNL